MSRLDRRKARTRQALIDAAVRLIAEGRGDRASIQEITEEADIGFGSFYNHFDSKEQLFQTASEEVLERWGQMIDRATAGITDPAELFAVGLRISGRLGWTHPDIAGFLTGAGLDALDIPVGLAPRALRDIEAGQATGRFTVPDAEIALSAVAGGLLGLLRICQRHPERVDETAVDQLAEAELRLLGVPAGEAARLVAAPASSHRGLVTAATMPSAACPCFPNRDEPALRQLSRYGWRPADPPRRPVLFINPRSGDGKAARAGLAERARDTGIEAVILDPGQDLAALADEAAAAGADALGMAGGDGSLAVVAAVAAAHGIPFVCVPAGTRNHFALDVGVDRRDVTGALEAFTAGVERRIDTAEVNGRLFLNNVSLGVYGDAVRSPAYRDAKVRTLLETAAEVMGPGAGELALDLIDDLGHEHRQPAVVLVSNNPYALDRPLARGTRPALDSGQLGIIVLDAPGDRPRVPGRAWSAPRLEVNAPAPVHAGVDGEAVDLEPPLRFASRPASLRVRISPRHPGASPSARLHLPGHPPA